MNVAGSQLDFEIKSPERREAMSRKQWVRPRSGLDNLIQQPSARGGGDPISSQDEQQCASQDKSARRTVARTAAGCVAMRPA
jgi:hypothetical protein